MSVGSNYYVIPRVIYKDADPDVNSDVSHGVEIGQFWKNTTTDDIFCCINNAAGAAVWYTSIFQIDPAEPTMPDYQTEINNMVAKKTFLVTPEIMYVPHTNTINYNVTIPTGAHGVSFGGVMTINEPYVVTIASGAQWTITK